MKSESKYIFSSGDLNRQDFSIRFKGEKRKCLYANRKSKRVILF